MVVGPLLCRDWQDGLAARVSEAHAHDVAFTVLFLGPLSGPTLRVRRPKASSKARGGLFCRFSGSLFDLVSGLSSLCAHAGWMRFQSPYGLD